MRVFAFLLCLISAPSFADGLGFMTPSGNIYCNGWVSDGGRLDCTIIEKDGPPAVRRPPSCSGVWGHEFRIDGRGAVEMLCGNRPKRVDYTDIAPYGVSAEFGNIQCTSLSTGFSCHNADGNGFFLSRRAQTITGPVRGQAGGGQASQAAGVQPFPNNSGGAGNRDVPRYNPNARWGADFRQGVREAFVQDGQGSGLRVVCNIGSALPIGSSISVQLAGTPIPAGSGGTLSFDGGRPVQIYFNDSNAFVVENKHESISHFNFIIGELKRNRSVLVSLSNGAQALFSLRGSSRAIGNCPAVPGMTPPRVSDGPQVPVNDPREGPAQVADAVSPVPQVAQGQQKQWLITEVYLQKLGFNPGAVDGVADAATMQAVEDFRQTYAIAGQGPLTSQQFKLLEALALTQKPSQPQSSSQPIISYGPASGGSADDTDVVAGLRPTASPVPAPIQSAENPEQTRPNAVLGSQGQNQTVIAQGNLGQTRPISANTKLRWNGGYPETKFELIDGHVVFKERNNLPGTYRAWVDWMLANMPLAMPEMADLGDETVVRAAHVLLTDAEQSAVEARLNLPFDVFLRGEAYEKAKHYNRRGDASDLLRRHARDLLNEQLDEFTRQGAMDVIRNVLKQKIAQTAPQLPLPVVQIYEASLGEYDFQSKSFPIESIRGAANSGKDSPESSGMMKPVEGAYSFGAGMESDTKEFPISIPMEPQAAKAFVDRLAAQRGDSYRMLTVGVFGQLNSMTLVPNDRYPEKPSIKVTHTVSRIDFAMDKNLADVVYRTVPDKLESDEVAAVTETGRKSPGRLYGPEYLVAALSDEFPNFLDAHGVMDAMMQDRIVLERADLAGYGLQNAGIRRILRPEILDGSREPNADDIRQYSSFLEGQKTAGLSNEIVLPLTVWVNADASGKKMVENFRPLDLVARGLNQAATRFGGINGGNTNGNGLSEPGRLVLPAAWIRGVERRSHVPVFFSLKLDKADPNPELMLPAGLKEPATRVSGPGRAFEVETYPGQLRGHIVLNLEKAPEVVEGVKNVRGGKAVVVKVSLKEILLLDQGSEIRFGYGGTGSDNGAAATAENVDVPETLFLDAETSDLLMIRDLPESVTEQDYERMLYARWEVERQHRDVNSAPDWGRFFDIGQPELDEQAVKSLLPAFKAWSQARARAMPETVRISVSKSLANVSGLVGFGNTFANPNSVSIGLMSCETDLRVMKGQRDSQKHKLQMVENACEYIRQAREIPSNIAYVGRTDTLPAEYRRNQTSNAGYGYLGRHGTVGVRIECGRFGGDRNYCSAYQKQMQKGRWGKTVFVLDDAYEFDKLVSVTPDVAVKAGERYSQLELVAKVTKVERSNRARLSPMEKAIRTAHAFLVSQEIREDRGGDFTEVPEVVPMNFFDLEIQAAEIVNRKTGQRLASVPLVEQPQAPDQALLSPVEREVPKAPTEPYGRDIVGLQLGMTFEEADRVIREHMDVGRVVYANGGWESFEVINEITPYSSGIAYESKDRKDIIIIYDQPPSAPKVVLGAIRQVALEKGKVSITQVFSAARKKYGQAEFQDNGKLSWGMNPDESGSRCSAFEVARTMRDVWRNEDGSKNPWPSENSTFLGKGGYGIAPPTPTNPERSSLDSAAYRCPPGLTINYDTQNNDNWDRIVFRLYDRKRYLDQVLESERMVRQGVLPAAAEAEKPAEELDIKF